MQNKFKIANDYISKTLEDHTPEYLVPEVDEIKKRYEKDHMFDEFINWYNEFLGESGISVDEMKDNDDLYDIYCVDYEIYEKFCEECELSEKDNTLWRYWLDLTNDIYLNWVTNMNEKCVEE